MAKALDLTGLRIGKLTVIKPSYKRYKNGSILWLCKCECGNICYVQANNLKNGHTKSCGCLKKNEDITNKKFGRLLVIEPIDARDSGWHKLWKCKCDCGNICNVVSGALRDGSTKSCGCLKTEISAISGKKIMQEVHDRNIVDNTNISIIKNNKPNKNNKTGFRGIAYNKINNKYIAQIAFKGHLYYLGYYETAKEASEAYQIAKEKTHFEFLKWYEKEYKND